MNIKKKRSHSAIKEMIKRRTNRFLRHDANMRLKKQLEKDDLSSPIRFIAVPGRHALKGVSLKRKTRRNDPLLTRAA